jgi:hypothetical protein
VRGIATVVGVLNNKIKIGPGSHNKSGPFTKGNSYQNLPMADLGRLILAIKTGRKVGKCGYSHNK